MSAHFISLFQANATSHHDQIPGMIFLSISISELNPSFHLTSLLRAEHGSRYNQYIEQNMVK